MGRTRSWIQPIFSWFTNEIDVNQVHNDGVFLGNFGTAANKNYMKELGITHGM